MGYIKAIVPFFKNLFRKTKDLPRDQIEKKGRKYFGQFVDEIPPENEIEDEAIYIIGEMNYEWLVVLRCPCGCNDIIQLNLLEGGKHIWRIVKRQPKRISIRPSIDRIVGCRSHFMVTNGEVIWWKDQNI